ncbi:MAG: hypothetical protein IKG56_03070 [Clostridia bacterium]|nr:hypothetical protein [Clostridia bacterium]
MKSNKEKNGSGIVLVILTFAIMLVITVSIVIYFIINYKIDQVGEKYNTIDNTAINENTINEEELPDNEDVKKAISDFLELSNASSNGYLLETLTQKGLLRYDSSKDIILDNERATTNVKFSDYKKAMLNFVTETEFEIDWKNDHFSIANFEEDSNGYVIKKTYKRGDGNYIYTINNIRVDSINRKNELTYYVESSYVSKNDNQAKNDSFWIHISIVNGKCLIDGKKMYID